MFYGFAVTLISLQHK